MYSSAHLALKIKHYAKEKHILIRDLLTACDMNVNALAQMTDKKGPSSFALARIADYLDCSVDYLLGRTAIPETNHGNVPEPTCQIKITSRDGDVKEITVPSKQLKELVNLLAIKDFVGHEF